MDVSEVIVPEKNYHSITITFSGNIINGALRSEPSHPYSVITPRWFSVDELKTIPYHPEAAIKAALDLRRPETHEAEIRQANP